MTYNFLFKLIAFSLAFGILKCQPGLLISTEICDIQFNSTLTIQKAASLII